MINTMSSPSGDAPTTAPPSRGDRGGGRSLATIVFEAVKREIVTSALPPESILVESDVAARFEVSRAPAREALKRLAETGLVRAVPRVGYIVTAVSLSDFEEIFAMRLALEPLAVELAVPRLTADELDQLEQLARGAQGAMAQPRADRGLPLADYNSRFHCTLARASGSGRLERTISGLIDDLERVLNLLARTPDVDPFADQHLRLVETIRGGDAIAAARLMHTQLRDDYRLMRELAIGATGDAAMRPYGGAA